jgi:hypothetical protein
MQNKRVSLARTIFAWVGAIAALSLLSGCAALTLTNLTPPALPDNPSEIYTFTLRVHPHTNVVRKNSIGPRIVVDGQIFPMKKSPLPDIWEFDYQLPAGRQEIAYYYLVDYTVEGNGQVNAGQAYTGVEHASIARRYVMSLDANRGPVGATIGILGRGFTSSDQVNFNGQPARSSFNSPNSINFFVPAVASGVYQVTVSNSSGSTPVGSFRVDGSTVSITPTSLNLAQGQTASLTFNIGTAAPAGGLLLDVATDIPASVIMPEVVVPEGSNSVTVSVKGGQPGTGSLVLRGYGDGQTVAVTVSGRAR